MTHVVKGTSKTHPPFTTMLLPTASQVEKQEGWRKYLGERKGTYDDRARRYALVGKVLADNGLDDLCQVTDFGAGQTEFDYYLRTALDWKGYMLNLDGALTGDDLNLWYAKGISDFTVCIETIEHMNKPGEIIAKLEAGTSGVVVFTTPNPDKVDVMSLCPDHKHAISSQDWEQMYYKVEVHDLFGNDGDTLVAWKDVSK